MKAVFMDRLKARSGGLRKRSKIESSLDGCVLCCIKFWLTLMRFMQKITHIWTSLAAIAVNKSENLFIISEPDRNKK